MNKLYLFIAILLFACNQDPLVPKPKGHIRLEIPTFTYQNFDTTFPYRFNYSSHARIVPYANNITEPYWINIEYPAFNATLYISYKKINNNLEQYLEDQRLFVNKHIPKANAINNRVYNNELLNVYGMTYEIIGPGTASPYQFYVTDSTTHFLRGSLYYNVPPNNDSLAPITKHLIQDIEQLINTLSWKNL